MVERGNIREWGAEHIQATLFTNNQHAYSAAALFLEAFNLEATQTNEQLHPQLGRLGAASRAIENGMMATLQLHPGRCDLLIHPDFEKVSGSEFPPKIKDISECVARLCGNIARISEKVTTVPRIAINCRLVKHFHAADEANSQIEKVLPFEYYLKGKKDFVFQINERKSEAGVHLNRLIKWAVEPIQMFSNRIDQPSSAALINEYWAAVVHLDFNSVVPGPILSTNDALTALECARASLLNALENNLRLS